MSRSLYEVHVHVHVHICMHVHVDVYIMRLLSCSNHRSLDCDYYLLFLLFVCLFVVVRVCTLRNTLIFVSCLLQFQTFGSFILRTLSMTRERSV